MVPIVKGGTSRTNGKSVAAGPIDRGRHGRGKGFGPVQINGALVRGDGKGNMDPFPCGHIDDTAIVPTFTPAGAHVQFNPLFGSISLAEQPETLVPVNGVIPYDNDSCPVRA